MRKKLSWEEIKDNYTGLWVELIDCDWDWSDSNPKSAKVLNFSRNRKKLISRKNKKSIILYMSSIISSSTYQLLDRNTDNYNQAVGY